MAWESNVLSALPQSILLWRLSSQLCRGISIDLLQIVPHSFIRLANSIASCRDYHISPNESHHHIPSSKIPSRPHLSLLPSYRLPPPTHVPYAGGASSYLSSTSTRATPTPRSTPSDLPALHLTRVEIQTSLTITQTKVKVEKAINRLKTACVEAMKLLVGL